MWKPYLKDVIQLRYCVCVWILLLFWWHNTITLKHFRVVICRFHLCHGVHTVSALICFLNLSSCSRVISERTESCQSCHTPPMLQFCLRFCHLLQSLLCVQFKVLWAGALWLKSSALQQPWFRVSVLLKQKSQVAERTAGHVGPREAFSPFCRLSHH